MQAAESFSGELTSVKTFCVSLRFLRRHRRLLLDDFDDFAQINRLGVLKHKVLGLKRFAFL